MGITWKSRSALADADHRPHRPERILIPDEHRARSIFPIRRSKGRNVTLETRDMTAPNPLGSASTTLARRLSLTTARHRERSGAESFRAVDRVAGTARGSPAARWARQGRLAPYRRRRPHGRDASRRPLHVSLPSLHAPQSLCCAPKGMAGWKLATLARRVFSFCVNARETAPSLSHGASSRRGGGRQAPARPHCGNSHGAQKP